MRFLRFRNSDNFLPNLRHHRHRRNGYYDRMKYHPHVHVFLNVLFFAALRTKGQFREVPRFRFVSNFRTLEFRQFGRFGFERKFEFMKSYEYRFRPVTERCDRRYVRRLFVADKRRGLKLNSNDVKPHVRGNRRIGFVSVVLICDVRRYSLKRSLTMERRNSIVQLWVNDYVFSRRQRRNVRYCNQLNGSARNRKKIRM